MTVTPTGFILPAAPISPGIRRQADAESGFALPGAAIEGGPSSSGAAHDPLPVASAGAMLALQEQAGRESDVSRDAADRDARRHGQELLEALAALQKALLTQDDAGGSLSRLIALVEAAPLAHDPALAGIVSAIRLRARLEILRRNPAAPA